MLLGRQRRDETGPFEWTQEEVFVREKPEEKTFSRSGMEGL